MGVDPARIAIWSRGVDENVFSPTRRSLQWRQQIGFNDDDIVVLFFGRLVREKGVATFIQVINQLQASGFRHQVLVVGTGPAESELRAGLPMAIFTGELEGAQLGRAVASADILLNPSHTEAFGNVNLEAMASGLAIVSADVGSAQALVEHETTGLLCATEPAAFARAVQRLIKSPALRSNIAEAALTASKAYRWANILTEVGESYRQLLNQGSHEREHP